MLLQPRICMHHPCNSSEPQDWQAAGVRYMPPPSETCSTGRSSLTHMPFGGLTRGCRDGLQDAGLPDPIGAPGGRPPKPPADATVTRGMGAARVVVDGAYGLSGDDGSCSKTAAAATAPPSWRVSSHTSTSDSSEFRCCRLPGTPQPQGPGQDPLQTPGRGSHLAVEIERIPTTTASAASAIACFPDSDLSRVSSELLVRSSSLRLRVISRASLLGRSAGLAGC